MNTPILHAELERLRSQYPAMIIDDLRNAYVVRNPFNFIDCEPDTNYYNFERLMNGEKLVYAEIANSTPNDGRHVTAGCESLVKKCARTSCVFGDEDIRNMADSVVGTSICSSHHYGWSLHGNVVESSMIEENFNGMAYNILGVLAWVDKDLANRRLDASTGMLYFSFCIKIDREICCQCGHVGTVENPSCDHVNDRKQNPPAMSICRFTKFDEIAIEE